MNSRLLYIIENKIAHTRQFTTTKRTIEFYRFAGTRIESLSLVIDLNNPRPLALRREVKRLQAQGYRVA